MSHPEPVNVHVAAARLHRSPRTIYSWSTRYGVRKWGSRDATLYDFADLATIEACINRGDPVPATPESRDELRASYAAVA
jgi:hypothetical protein